VERFCGVKKKRRRAGTGKGGGNLAANEARFAHPRDDNAAFTGEEKIDGAFEGSVEACEKIVTAAVKAVISEFRQFAAS